MSIEVMSVLQFPGNRLFSFPLTLPTYINSKYNNN